MISLINISSGGPEFNISVGGKIYHFEMHPYCGPIALNKKGNELSRQPNDFLKAASLWAQQGQKVEEGLCVWYHEPEAIRTHLGGRHWQMRGYKPAVRGK